MERKAALAEPLSVMRATREQSWGLTSTPPEWEMPGRARRPLCSGGRRYYRRPEIRAIPPRRVCDVPFTVNQYLDIRRARAGSTHDAREYPLSFTSGRYSGVSPFFRVFRTLLYDHYRRVWIRDIVTVLLAYEDERVRVDVHRVHALGGSYAANTAHCVPSLYGHGFFVGGAHRPCESVAKVTACLIAITVEISRYGEIVTISNFSSTGSGAL